MKLIETFSYFDYRKKYLSIKEDLLGFLEYGELFENTIIFHPMYKNPVIGTNFIAFERREK